MCRREERKNCLSLILKLDLGWKEGIPSVHIPTGDRAARKSFGNVAAWKGRRGQEEKLDDSQREREVCVPRQVSG